MLDILEMLQLPRDVEGDMYGTGSNGEGGGYVALKGVANHQHFTGQDVETLAELLELKLGLV